jgi:hypothetical protein
MIHVTEAPKAGSVFSPTRVKGVVETFVSASIRSDLPPCEYVQADFGVVTATVSDLGPGDDGSIRRECDVVAGGVVTGFESLELDRSVADGSVFGSRSVDDRTIERIRRWAIGHGIPDLGPAVSAAGHARSAIPA